MTQTKLASLVLHGYKTFAKETNLVFPARITAIVGPNGSGKSNVADSIRWVLGEQSYSMLRAKKTEDMIYSGSENRSRAGMAPCTSPIRSGDCWSRNHCQDPEVRHREKPCLPGSEANG